MSIRPLPRLTSDLDLRNLDGNEVSVLVDTAVYAARDARDCGAVTGVIGLLREGFRREGGKRVERYLRGDRDTHNPT